MENRSRTAFGVTVRLATVMVMAVAAAAGCGDGEVPMGDAAIRRDGASDAADATLDGPGGEAGLPDVAPGDVTPADSSCAAIEARSSIVRRPLDVIVVVDGSSSFDAPRRAISSTLAANLIAALEAAMVDYRVVVIGGAITAPAPTTPPRYFFIPVGIGSGGFLTALPGYLRMALPRLREDSLKAVVAFTDDGSGIGPRSGFYTGMMAADLARYFGTMAMPRYTVHTVAGLAANAPPTMPWPPTAPLVTTRCSGFSANPAQELQSLSRETGGYRFPLCNFMQYSNLFDAIAALSIAGLRVPCEFGFPTLRDGRMPDIVYARATVRRGDGSMMTFLPVTDPAMCGDGFYRVPATSPGDAGMGGDAGSAGGDRVRLCPSTCAMVQMDEAATVSFTFECPPG